MKHFDTILKAFERDYPGHAKAVLKLVERRPLTYGEDRLVVKVKEFLVLACDNPDHARSLMKFMTKVPLSPAEKEHLIEVEKLLAEVVVESVNNKNL
jgi:hypothetical protein